MSKSQRKAEPSSIADLPQKPAVYALYGGSSSNLHVAYVGITARLRGRIQQHLVNRDSSVTTGTSAAGLNPDYVTEVRWWQGKWFSKKTVREAAELVAYDVLQPVLRSRGKVTAAALELSQKESFRNETTDLFSGEPTGRLVLYRVQDAFARLSRHDERLSQIEARLDRLERRGRPRRRQRAPKTET